MLSVPKALIRSRATGPAGRRMLEETRHGRCRVKRGPPGLASQNARTLTSMPSSPSRSRTIAAVSVSPKW
jgi:hypothetical protein